MALRKVTRVDTNTIIEYYGPWLKLLVASERKVLIHTALREGGTLWMLKYIPLRFSNYAYGLGYRVTEQWKKFKRRVLGGNAMPYIGVTPPGGGATVVSKGGKIFRSKKNRNFEKLATAVEKGSNVKVRGTSQGGDIHIAIPYGHPLNPSTSAALRKLPKKEIDEVCNEVARQMAALVGSAQARPRSRKGKLTIRGASSSIKSRATGLAG